MAGYYEFVPGASERNPLLGMAALYRLPELERIALRVLEAREAAVWVGGVPSLLLPGFLAGRGGRWLHAEIIFLPGRERLGFYCFEEKSTDAGDSFHGGLFLGGKGAG